MMRLLIRRCPGRIAPLILLLLLVRHSSATTSQPECSESLFIPLRARIVDELADHTNDFLNFSERHYGTPALGRKIFAALTALDPRFENLVSDPGLVVHLDEFVRIAMAMQGELPRAVYQKFRADLGKTRVYRALALTDAELEHIRFNGMTNRARKASVQDISMAVSQYGIEPLLEERRSRWNNEDISANPFLSVTSQKDFAIAIAKDYLGANKRIFLFTIDLPVADLIYFGKYLPRTIEWKLPYHMPDELYVRYSDGKYQFFSNNKDLESFVLGRIEPSEIVDIQDVTDYPVQAWDWVTPEIGRPSLVTRAYHRLKYRVRTNPGLKWKPKWSKIRF